MATTKTSKKTIPSKEQISIPSAIRDEKPENKKTANSLLAGLVSKGKISPDKKTKDRPVIELQGEYASIYGRFAPARQLADIFTATAEALKTEINCKLFECWVNLFWKNRSVPDNPTVKGVSDKGDVCEGMFIVQERWKLRVPEGESPNDLVAKTLVNLGVDSVKAEKLVENELDFRPTVSVKPFNDLVEGSEKEQAVAQKLLEFITNELSDEEKELVLKNESKVTVKSGFLNRVLEYANTENQLSAILKVLDPVVQNKGAKFATTASPVDRLGRLLEEASSILGEDEE